MAAVAPALTSPFQAEREKGGRIPGQASQTQCMSRLPCGSQAQDKNLPVNFYHLDPCDMTSPASRQDEPCHPLLVGHTATENRAEGPLVERTMNIGQAPFSSPCLPRLSKTMLLYAVYAKQLTSLKRAVSSSSARKGAYSPASHRS